VSVNALSLPQRVARAVGASPVAEKVAAAQTLVYGPIPQWARRSPFHTAALGVGLGLTGNAVAAGAGFLGGHLALNRGTARRSHAADAI